MYESETRQLVLVEVFSFVPPLLSITFEPEAWELEVFFTNRNLCDALSFATTNALSGG
jgi:hypothetical protein